MSAGFLAIAAAFGVSALHAQEYAGPQGQSQGQGGRGNEQRGFPRTAEARDNSHNSLSDSVRRVQRERGVRVLSAERVPFDGRDINRIKYVDERGRVRYMDDAGNSRRRTVQRDEGEEAPPPARGDNPSHP